MEARLFLSCFFCLITLTVGTNIFASRGQDADSAFFNSLLKYNDYMEDADYNYEMPENNRNNNNKYKSTDTMEHPVLRNVKYPGTKVRQHVKFQSTSTSGPDVLASMPPVTPDKGQKEYVMLRPPVDNHHKIEHWIHDLAMEEE